MSAEKRTSFLHVRILPSIKEAAEKAASEEGRTLSNYIERLIVKETKKKG